MGDRGECGLSCDRCGATESEGAIIDGPFSREHGGDGAYGGDEFSDYNELCADCIAELEQEEDERCEQEEEEWHAKASQELAKGSTPPADRLPDA